VSGDKWILDRLAALERRVSALEGRTAAPARPSGRSRQLGEDWTPEPGTLRWAKEKYPDVDEPKEREKFRNYWQARGEPRRDWQAAYRNWIIRESEYAAERGGPRRPRPNGPASRTESIDRTNRERTGRVAARLAEIWKTDKS
jgi:hypothetical protein